jgi:hypothetical protein
MSSSHPVEAGEDWCMTDTFARAMKGQYRKIYPQLLQTQDMVELMEDHHSIIKDDWMQATLTGSAAAIDPVAPFPFKYPSPNSCNVTTQQQCRTHCLIWRVLL